jgi:hypothetical protein
LDKPVGGLLYGVGEQIVAYLPNLVGGLILIGIGWFLSWAVKRIVIQFCLILRLDRLLRRFRWGAGFAKADVRYALFEWIGNFAAFVLFFVFLDAALIAMQLEVLARLLEQAVSFVPKLVIAAAIFGLGWVISGAAAASMLRALHQEDIPRATLIARFTRLVLMIFFFAMALTEIGIARDIVVIGFAAIMVTLCLATLILLWLGGAEGATRLLGSPRSGRRGADRDDAE